MLDQLVAELFVVLGTFAMVVLVGWRMEAPAEELLRGASGRFERLVPAVLFLLRWILPLAVGAVVLLSLRETWLLFG